MIKKHTVNQHCHFYNNSHKVNLKILEASFSDSNNDFELYLTCICSPKVYQYIDDHHLFGLQPKYKKEIWGGSFDASQQYQIELRFRPELTDFVKTSFDNLVDFTKILLKAKDFSNPFQNTKSWLALNVTQALKLPENLKKLGNLRFGYETHWNDYHPKDFALGILVESFLIKNKIQYTQNQTNTNYQFLLKSGSSQWPCSINVLQPEYKIVMVSMYSLGDIKLRKEQLLEFINQANIGLIGAGISADFNAGKLYLSLSASVSDIVTFSDIMIDLFKNCYNIHQYYISELLRISILNKPVDDLIREIEKNINFT